MSHEHKSCILNHGVACCICQPHGCHLTSPTTPSPEELSDCTIDDGKDCKRCSVQLQDWKKRFDSEWGDWLKQFLGGPHGTYEGDSDKFVSDLKSYISDLLLEEREDERERTIADARSRLAMVHPKKDANPQHVADHCYHILQRMSRLPLHKQYDERTPHNI